MTFASIEREGAEVLHGEEHPVNDSGLWGTATDNPQPFDLGISESSHVIKRHRPYVGLVDFEIHKQLPVWPGKLQL